ncbi:MAG: glycosyltransferase family 9 protein [Armatimonadota bacterium]
MRARPRIQDIDRLVIVKLSAIGDMVHALPVLAALKRAKPQMQISWIVDARYAGLLTDHPLLHEVIVLPVKRWQQGFHKASTWLEIGRASRKLRKAKFQLTIDIQGLAKSALMALLTGAKTRLGHSDQREGSHLLNRAVPRVGHITHVTDSYLDILRYLGVPAEPVEFPIYIDESAKKQVIELIAETGIDTAKLITINPSAGQPQKRWAPASFAETADILSAEGHDVVFVGSPNDKPLVQQIVAQCHQKVYDFSGRTSLKALAELLRISMMHISGDTGSAHIASGLGTAVLGLYGPTNPSRSHPWGQQQHVVSHYGCCEDCNSRFHCKLRICMDRISVDEVIDMAHVIINEVRHD